VRKSLHLIAAKSFRSSSLYEAGISHGGNTFRDAGGSVGAQVRSNLCGIKQVTILRSKFKLPEVHCLVLSLTVSSLEGDGFIVLDLHVIDEGGSVGLVLPLIAEESPHFSASLVNVVGERRSWHPSTDGMGRARVMRFGAFFLLNGVSCFQIVSVDFVEEKVAMLVMDLQVPPVTLEGLIVVQVTCPHLTGVADDSIDSGGKL